MLIKSKKLVSKKRSAKVKTRIFVFETGLKVIQAIYWITQIIKTIFSFF